MLPVILHSIILCENNVLASGEILQLNAQQYVFGIGPWYCDLTFFFSFKLPWQSRQQSQDKNCKEVVKKKKKKDVISVFNLQIKCAKLNESGNCPFLTSMVTCTFYKCFCKWDHIA